MKYLLQQIIEKIKIFLIFKWKPLFIISEIYLYICACLYCFYLRMHVLFFIRVYAAFFTCACTVMTRIFLLKETSRVPRQARTSPPVKVICSSLIFWWLFFWHLFPVEFLCKKRKKTSTTLKGKFLFIFFSVRKNDSVRAWSQTKHYKQVNYIHRLFRI